MLALFGSLPLPQLSPSAPVTARVEARETFEIRGDQFVLNGKPFVIRSGEMHYPRVPHQAWRERMRMAKAMGLNTLCTYTFWNLHEATLGRFDFSGDLDLARFVKMAQEEGLYVIIRPGPYICTELDFGGFPAWLLKDRSLVVRSRDPKFLAAADRYLGKIGEVVRPLLMQNGGPVIMAQVENEYGSYGDDHEYMAWMRDAMVRAGFSCPLFTSDGPGQDQLKGGTLPGLTPVINFGGGAEGAFRELAKFRPGTPRMIGEYWAGWFDQWGRAHHTTNIANHVKDLAWCLANGVSFNVYMFHGGTNWGFLAGSNGGANDFTVDVTSYDYDSPLDEAGRPTAKYLAFRDALAKGSGETFPAVPPAPRMTTVPRFALRETGQLLADLPRPVRSESPQTFEELDQAHGLVLYRTRAGESGKQMLRLNRLGDYATVFVNGKRIGVLDRRRGQKSMELDLPAGGVTIDLLVEALSRVNFGRAIVSERKGIDGAVTLGDRVLMGWDHYRFPIPSIEGSKGKSAPSGEGPRFYRGSFRGGNLGGGTFLDMRGWTKGFVWVNGRNLGRFWKIGPQQTLFVPGAWLRAGQNDVLVYDDGARVARPSLAGIAEPILDQVEVDTSRLNRKPGQNLKLAGIAPVLEGSFAEGVTAQEVKLPAAKGRYLCIEAIDAHGDSPYTTIAELWAVGADGRDLPRTDWKILYADSEETEGENGAATNVFDLQPTTFWHTQWSGAQPAHPHQIVIDLGASIELSGLRYLPRQDMPTGRIKNFQVYVSDKPFPGI